MTGKSLVLVYGRFQPLHYMHDALITYAMTLAGNHRSDLKLYTTHTQDPDENPLSYQFKTEIIKFMYDKQYWHSSYGSIFQETKLSSITKIIEELDKEYDEIRIIVGGDRYNKFYELFETYKDDYKAKIYVINFLDRSVINISSSSMRNYAKEGNYKSFIQCLPSKIYNSVYMRDKIYEEVIAGLNRKDESKGSLR